MMRFIKLPHRIFSSGLAAEIGPNGIAVYCVLLKHAKGPGTTCYPSHATIAAEAGVSIKTSQRATKILAERRLIRTTKRFTGEGKASNLYEILDSDSQSLGIATHSRHQDDAMGTHSPYRTLEVATHSPSGSDSQSLGIATHSRPKKNHRRRTKKKTSCRANKFADEDMQVAKEIWSNIHAMQPSRKAPKLETWANTIRMMRVLDKRSHDDVLSLFSWANSDRFWRTNILSPSKLREKWDDLDLKRQGQRSSTGAVACGKGSAPPPRRKVAS